MEKEKMLIGKEHTLLVCIVVLLGASFPEWETEIGSNFTVHHVQEDTRVAESVLAEAASFFPFSRALRPDVLKNRVHIFIAPSQEIFNELTQGAIPHWGIACALPHRDMIVVKSPRIVEVWRENLTVILRHELVHIFLNRMTFGMVPRWFNEGVAIYMSGEWNLRDNLDLAIAVVQKNVIPLDEMHSSYPSAESKVNLFYLESYSAVAYLSALLGNERFKSFFHRLLTSGTFESALYQHTGMTVEEFQERWERWLKRNYHPVSLFGRTEFLFTLFILIMITAYIVRRIRYKKVLAEMEAIETIEGKNYRI